MFIKNNITLFFFFFISLILEIKNRLINDFSQTLVISKIIIFILIIYIIYRNKIIYFKIKELLKLNEVILLSFILLFTCTIFFSDYKKASLFSQLLPIFFCLSLIFYNFRTECVVLSFKWIICLISFMYFLTIIFLIINPEFILSTHIIRSFFRNFLYEPFRYHSLFISPGIFGFITSIPLLLAPLIFKSTIFQYVLIILPSLYFLASADSKSALLSTFLISIYLLFTTRIKVYILNIFFCGALLISSLNMNGLTHRVQIWASYFQNVTSISAITPNIATKDSNILPVSHPHNIVISIDPNALDVITNKTTGFSYQRLFLIILRSLLLLSICIFTIKIFYKSDSISVALIAPVLIYSLFDFGISWTSLNLFNFFVFLSIAYNKSLKIN